VETENVNYTVSDTAIKDKSMLGAHGQKLCRNIDVHWMTPSCGDADDSNEGKLCNCTFTVQKWRDVQ